MTCPDRSLVRLAAAMLASDNQARRRPPSNSLYLPTYLWDRARALVAQIEVAERRRWNLAADRLRAELRAVQRRLMAEISDVLNEASPSPACRVTLRDVYEDLVALGREFEDVEHDLQEGTLAVTTSSIKLAGVQLGQFKIELTWRDHEYRVIALDPHPAARDQDVTHPHVKNESLCAGEGKAAIGAALAQGRLFDFFLLVSRVLQTYSASNPYVALDEWHGTNCADCGYSTDEDDYSCHSCDEAVCSECVCRCSRCEAAACGKCSRECHLCGQEFCQNCVERHAGSRQVTCHECLSEIQHEGRRILEPGHTDTTATPAAEAA